MIGATNPNAATPLLIQRADHQTDYATLPTTTESTQSNHSLAGAAANVTGFTVAASGLATILLGIHGDKTPAFYALAGASAAATATIALAAIADSKKDNQTAQISDHTSSDENSLILDMDSIDGNSFILDSNSVNGDTLINEKKYIGEIA